jgi:8-oxo-dGTP pyrophosphatase MutT (NUDIX family)
MNKDLTWRTWNTSAAGHVDAGEDYESCAIREVKEELGIDVANNIEPLFNYRPPLLSAWNLFKSIVVFITGLLLYGG